MVLGCQDNYAEKYTCLKSLTFPDNQWWSQKFLLPKHSLLLFTQFPNWKKTDEFRIYYYFSHNLNDWKSMETQWV